MPKINSALDTFIPLVSRPAGGQKGMGVFTLAVESGKEEVGQCFICVWFGFVDKKNTFVKWTDLI